MNLEMRLSGFKFCFQMLVLADWPDFRRGMMRFLQENLSPFFFFSRNVGGPHRRVGRRPHRAARFRAGQTRRRGVSYIQRSTDTRIPHFIHVEEWDIAHHTRKEKSVRHRPFRQEEKDTVIEDGFSRGVLRRHQDPRGRVEQERTP